MLSSRRGAIAAIALASLGGAAIIGQVASAAPTTNLLWASTATKAVDFNAPRLGALAPHTKLQLEIALTPRNQAGLNSLTHAIYTPGSEQWHRYLTPADYRAEFAPTTATVARVTTYLHQQGFKNVAVAGDRLMVSTTATAAQAERAFHTSISNFRVNGKKIFGNTSAAMVPAALGGVVTSVIGLDNEPLHLAGLTHVTPNKKKGSGKTGSPDLEGGLFPKQFDTTYDARGVNTGRKTRIALFTEGNMKPVIKSLRLAERKEHLRKAKVTVQKIGPQSKDVSGADEFDMDSQTSTSTSGGVKHLYLYNVGSLIDPDIDRSITSYVSQDKARAMSASIGGCEVFSYLDGSEVAIDQVMQEAATQGQSLFVSTGDDGDACPFVTNTGAPTGPPGDQWPAVGTYNTAVGGTSLITDSKGHRITELGWLGGGGGFSTFENPGFWTEDTDLDYTGNYVTGGRAIPDIALDADPNVATPAKVYVGKTIDYVGGTSLSSPMMLGFWARMETKHHNKLGLASIPLYAVYDKVNPGTHTTAPEVGVPVVVPAADPKPVKGFYDIVAGADGIYSARPGYDEVTGLGAPDVKKLNKVIK